MKSVLYPWREDIDPATIPDEILYSEVGKRRVAKRKKASGGRPQDPIRCPCGQYPLLRALTRGHVCKGIEQEVAK